MENWIQLSEQECTDIYRKINTELHFKPSMSKFPSFKAPYPFITYDVSNYYNEKDFLEFENDLETKVLLVFQELTSCDEKIVAFDWQHEAYWFNPHLPFEKNEFEEWHVPIFPNGDYYFFIQKKFKWGLLGHPWEKSITIFGEEMIKCVSKYQPKLFKKMIRSSL